MTPENTRICEPCKGSGWSGTYSQPAGQPYADFGPDKCQHCRGAGEVPTRTADARDLLDEADQRMTRWLTRHRPDHGLNVRAAGADAAEALREASRLLMAQAIDVQAEVDAYDAQQSAFLESVHHDIGGGAL
jgi:hypothetical protein